MLELCLLLFIIFFPHSLFIVIILMFLILLGGLIGGVGNLIKKLINLKKGKGNVVKWPHHTRHLRAHGPFPF